ncbi:MAG TPA: hypothetical protein DCQ64_15615 [Candidatus Rokubacteria bacterium]|nr:hypothetical protein [Candidatus Rokubacteria bacterium]
MCRGHAPDRHRGRSWRHPMGRRLFTIVGDTCGRHDTLGGGSDIGVSRAERIATPLIAGVRASDNARISPDAASPPAEGARSAGSLTPV